MLKRWLNQSAKKAPEADYLPNPRSADTPEKSLAIAAAYKCVLEAVSEDYNHYNSEQRLKIAKYAIENGVSKAAKHFSTVLKSKVNESSVRSIKSSCLLKIKCGTITLDETKLESKKTLESLQCFGDKNRVFVKSQRSYRI
ncbi:hypothetical protein KUTeg_017797 [Tegillarca granosa]|uniref:Uncharacterized protein n=1 Tax=Tegillarca granosa TaxID=220873 RepID=A0ABQ9EHJ6_TEGGR|nr:hypothetical protein KUTeg_017797 [Tegillarca granosa]